MGGCTRDKELRWVARKGQRTSSGTGRSWLERPHTYTPTASEEDFKAMLKKCGFGKLVRKKKKGLAQKSSRPFVTNLSLEILNALGIQQSRSVAEGGID